MRRWYAAAVPFVAVLLVSSPAAATTGDLGHDISYPNCSQSTPASGTFGIVGVNNGTATFSNPCLQAQAAWAAGLPQPPMLYANTANATTTSTFYKPTSGASDPAYCANAASTTDPGCAYDYGWHVAQDALTVQAAGQVAIDPRSVLWWLDVESVNTWTGDGISNAADLQGMVDYLRSQGVPDVGVYALSADWSQITGSSSLGTSGYTRGTSNLYRAHWPFTPKYPIEDGPVWFPGAGTSGDASAKCGTSSLTGGEKLLAQYDDAGLDGDYRCADADHIAPTAAMTAPTAFVTTPAGVLVGWKAADTGGSGVASFDLQVVRASATGGFGSWSAVGRRLLTTARTLTSPARGYTACWAVRSRDAAGNVSALSTRRCTTRPLDDRDLSASSGWSRTTAASGWFTSSYSSSTHLGATLSRTALQTSHLVLLAYRCPTCGSVTVLLNGTVLKTVSLASSTSGRVQIALPRFSLRTTKVTLRVATSGKLVRIDGLATSRV